MIIRNNLVYGANSSGISVGGYAKSGTGGSSNITIVNNSLYNNDLQQTGSGEFQIQYRATGIVFENNIVYTGAQGLFIHGYVAGSGVTANYNDYRYTKSATTTFELNGKTYSTFAAYKAATGEDANLRFSRIPITSLYPRMHDHQGERSSDPDLRPARRRRILTSRLPLPRRTRGMPVSVPLISERWISTGIRVSIPVGKSTLEPTSSRLVRALSASRQRYRRRFRVPTTGAPGSRRNGCAGRAGDHAGRCSVPVRRNREVFAGP